VFKRVVVVLTAVALVVGALALPALAQEEGSEEGTPSSCAEFIENVQRYLTDYAVGKITAGEAATEVAAELDSALADEVVCSKAELQRLAKTPGATDVAEILAAQYAPAR
jgi:hypothetical protein